MGLPECSLSRTEYKGPETLITLAGIGRISAAKHDPAAARGRGGLPLQLR